MRRYVYKIYKKMLLGQLRFYEDKGKTVYSVTDDFLIVTAYNNSLMIYTDDRNGHSIKTTIDVGFVSRMVGDIVAAINRLLYNTTEKDELNKKLSVNIKPLSNIAKVLTPDLVKINEDQYKHVPSGKVLWWVGNQRLNVTKKHITISKEIYDEIKQRYNNQEISKALK